ncbi:MAG: hypothetical protein ACO1SX_23975 [Actinomycetota bacterium]
MESTSQQPAARRTNVFFYPEDDAAIQAIKLRYGVSTDSDAVRLALRIFAQGRVVLLADNLPSAPDLEGLRLEDVQVGCHL